MDTPPLMIIAALAMLAAIIVLVYFFVIKNRSEGYGNAVTYNCMTNMGSSVGNVVTDQGIAAATQQCKNSVFNNTNSRNAANGTYARVAPPPSRPSWLPPCSLCWLYSRTCSEYGCSK